MAKYLIHFCGGDMRGRVEPDNTCPNRDEHTYGPAGYVDWHEWAATMTYQRRRQTACPGCGRFLIWFPKPDLKAATHG